MQQDKVERREHDRRTEERRLEELGWHLDKKVPISMILAILSLALTGFWGFADLKKDVELLKANALVLHQRDDKQEADIKDSLAQIRQQYDALSAKLDRLIERQK